MLWHRSEQRGGGWGIQECGFRGLTPRRKITADHPFTLANTVSQRSPLSVQPCTICTLDVAHSVCLISETRPMRFAAPNVPLIMYLLSYHWVGVPMSTARCHWHQFWQQLKRFTRAMHDGSGGTDVFA